MFCDSLIKDESFVKKKEVLDLAFQKNMSVILQKDLARQKGPSSATDN